MSYRTVEKSETVPRLIIVAIKYKIFVLREVFLRRLGDTEEMAFLTTNYKTW